jgi:hypothetical protein
MSKKRKPRTDLWSTELKAEMLRLYAEGLSRPEIARRLGKTKNAIIGQLDRLTRQGKPLESPKRHNKNNNPWGITATRLAEIRAKAKSQEPKPVPLRLPAAERLTEPKSITELKHRQCRYIGERPELLTLDTPIYCGAATDGGSWCPAHRARVIDKRARFV